MSWDRETKLILRWGLGLFTLALFLRLISPE